MEGFAMKRLLYAAFAIGVISCNNGGNGGQSASDTITTISPDTPRTGQDTTGLNVGAAQPVNPNDTLRDAMPNEPGARKSHVQDETTEGGGGNQ